MKLLPFGDRAFLAEVDGINAVLALYRALESSRPDGVIDLVPAARTVLVAHDPRQLSREAAELWVRSVSPNDDGASRAGAGRTVTIDVDYSGPDLDLVAVELGMSASAVVQLHLSSEWTAAFTGFAPGFAYLVTDHDRLRVTRRPSPRTRVPAGSVGLAGEFSGIYPRESPGGWQLIGRTEAILWDSGQEHPALLQPGCSVRFRAL